jgi:hypothetical protein
MRRAGHTGGPYNACTDCLGQAATADSEVSRTLLPAKAERHENVWGTVGITPTILEPKYE